uniref:Uncharacterized protein n=1 Tax=Prymnesium polylepis TaxID=72548 RepID=A0A7S4J4E8_9EUKA
MIELELSEDGATGPRTTIQLEVQWCQWQQLPDGAFLTDEMILQRVTTSGEPGQPEIAEATLIESITRFEPPLQAARRGDRNPAPPGSVRARNRLAQYLLPSPAQQGGGALDPGGARAAKMAALAAGRAVTMFDYEWRLTPTAEDLPITGLSA